MKKYPNLLITINSVIMELCKLQSSQHIQQKWTDVDACDGQSNANTITYCNIVFTVISMFSRPGVIAMNWILVFDYWHNGQWPYGAWTAGCILVPISVTTMIYLNMLYQDGNLNQSVCRVIRALVVSYIFRDWDSLVYAWKCKRAEERGDKGAQLKYFKLNIHEESDVALIKLFDSFLESAPQKILLIAIVLSDHHRITHKQAAAICLYFGSIAWCLAAYHRSNRCAQIDKPNINTIGCTLQLCWHFCISVSRTLCIAFIASIFPMYTFITCVLHATLFGLITYIVERPKFAATSFFNFLFALALGIVYLFTYIPVKDAPTRRKFVLYYLICSIENIVCIIIFRLYAADDMIANTFLFYALCVSGLIFYYFGITFMIIYYLYFHPQITARKAIPNNN